MSNFWNQLFHRKIYPSTIMKEWSNWTQLLLYSNKLSIHGLMLQYFEILSKMSLVCSSSLFVITVTICLLRIFPNFLICLCGWVVFKSHLPTLIEWVIEWMSANESPAVSTYIVLMVWLKSPVSAFQNFLWIENRLNIKKVMGRNVWMCFVLTVSTHIV